MRLIDAEGVIEEIKRDKLLAIEPAVYRCMEIIKNATTYAEPPEKYEVKNEDVLRMLESIEHEEYCKDVQRSDCQGEDNCMKCMVRFCRKQLEQGKILRELVSN